MSAPNDSSAVPLPSPTPVEQAALAWFARCERGLSAAEEAQFEEWLCSDPQHAALFSELSGTWRMLGEAAPATAASQPQTPPARASTARWRRWVLPLAAAAALALGYWSYWRPQHYSGEAATEIGALHTMRLPDGSVVKLNTSSQIAVDFSPAERRVRLLHGEASFEVAKNAERPFTVTANGIAVRAVGTAFNVRLSPQSVEVLVLEGRVKVSDAVSGSSLLATGFGAGDAGDVLAPGQRAVVELPPPVVERPAPPPARVTMLPPDEVRRRNAWQERRLEFEAAPLREMVAEFNRFNRHKLVIADPALGEERFGGSFRADDAEGFVRMLRDNFGVATESMEGVTVLRAGR